MYMLENIFDVDTTVTVQSQSSVGLNFFYSILVQYFGLVLVQHKLFLSTISGRILGGFLVLYFGFIFWVASLYFGLVLARHVSLQSQVASWAVSQDVIRVGVSGCILGCVIIPASLSLHNLRLCPGFIFWVVSLFCILGCILGVSWHVSWFSILGWYQHTTSSFSSQSQVVSRAGTTISDSYSADGGRCRVGRMKNLSLLMVSEDVFFNLWVECTMSG